MIHIVRLFIIIASLVTFASFLSENVSAVGSAVCVPTPVCPDGLTERNMTNGRQQPTIEKVCLTEPAEDIFGNPVQGRRSGDRVEVCLAEERIARVKGTDGNFGDWNEFYCCPVNMDPIWKQVGFTKYIVCCPQGYQNDFEGNYNKVVNVVNNLYTPAQRPGNAEPISCKNANDQGRSPGEGLYNLLLLTDPHGRAPEQSYSCQPNNCVAVDEDPDQSSPVPTTRSGCEQNCYPPGYTLKEKRCYSGSWITEEEYERRQGAPGATGCETIVGNDAEKNLCIECTSSPNTIWTAIGCVDYSRDGIITRLFQIGIGIIGGVMIIRFLQAAIMMQTDNPEQIREAKELITSALIALVVLVGAVVILRFLGINVLGILPENFLGG